MEEGTRGRYLQRLYAQSAMQDHVGEPEAFRKGVPPPDVGAALRRQVNLMGPVQILLSAAVLFAAVVAGIFVVSESASSSLVDALR